MAPSLAALHSAAASHLPHPRHQRTAALARSSSLLRLQLRRRSRWVAAEFATGGAGGGGKARRGVGIDVAAVGAALRDARTADDVESVVNAFLNHDNNGGGLLHLQVYTCVIRGLGKSNGLDAAFAVVEHLKRRGAALNQFVYNCLLGAVKSSGGEVGRIQAVLDDMAAQGGSPNIVTYNTLMSIYADYILQ